MAAIAFDTLKFVRRLQEAGVPAEQAEAQAEVMAETFLHNTDRLVTTDYLDARLSEQDARIDARFAGIDARLDGMDVRFAGIDARFAGIDARLDGIDARLVGIDVRLAGFDVSLTELKGDLRLQRWILGAIAASTVLPALNTLLQGL
jgi:hypothetical protein